MSAVGVPVISRKEKFNPPQAANEVFFQNDSEMAICMVTLSARDNAKQTGLFCKSGSELVVLVTQLLVPNKSSAAFASAEFFFTGGGTAEHITNLDPDIYFELLPNDVAVIGVPKTSAPKYEEFGSKGSFIDLQPMRLCTDPFMEYPRPGAYVLLIAHPFGRAKAFFELQVRSIDMKNGKVHFTEPAPEGCHGAPLLFDDKCFAILNQPRIRELATTGNLIHTIIGKGLDVGEDDDDIDDENDEFDADEFASEHKNDDGEVTQLEEKESEEEEGTIVLSNISKFLPNDTTNVDVTKTVAPNSLSIKDVDKITRAVEKGNLEAILWMQHKVGLDTLRNWRDFNGRTLVHFAAFYSNPVSLSGLKRQGYSLSETTKVGDTAVHIACYNGSLPCLKLLHKWGCSLTAINLHGDRPSHKAALRGRLDVLAYLHNCGVDVASPLNGQGLSPLDISKESGSWDCRKLLEAAKQEAEATSVGKLHVPGFYKVPENWPSVLPPGPGTRENRDIRTRESTRGQETNGNQRGIETGTMGYLKAKNKGESKRALNIIRKTRRRVESEKEERKRDGN